MAMIDLSPEVPKPSKVDQLMAMYQQLLMQLRDQYMEAHKVDDDLLQQIAMARLDLYGEDATFAGDLAKHGIRIKRCCCCLKWKWTEALHFAYGLDIVCRECEAKYYTYCSGCDSLKLVNDVSVHSHAMAIVNSMPEWEPKKWNTSIADIYPGFLIDPTEKNIPEDKIRFLGIEIEFERSRIAPSPPDLVWKALKLLPPRTAIAVRDGSLSMHPLIKEKGSNGFEIVTVPMSLRAAMNQCNWHKFFETLSPWVDNTAYLASVHVHVSLDSVLPIVLARAVIFFNSAANIGFLIDIAGRDFRKASPENDNKVYAKTFDPNTKVRELVSMKTHDMNCSHHPLVKPIIGYYGDSITKRVVIDDYGHRVIQRIDSTTGQLGMCHCKRGTYNYDPHWNPHADVQCSHYAAFNVQTNKPTCEIRIGRNTCDANHFLGYVQFCECIFDFCAAHTKKQMNYTTFLEWFRSRRRHYPNLSSWLEIKGYLEPRKGKK